MSRRRNVMLARTVKSSWHAANSTYRPRQARQADGQAALVTGGSPVGAVTLNPEREAVVNTAVLEAENKIKVAA